MRIGVRLKIAALWTAMLFLFAYGDIFGFFNTGRIEEVIAGEISGMKITQGWAYFYFLSIVETALLLLIIWYAWTWPQQVPEGQISGGEVGQGGVRAS